MLTIWTGQLKERQIERQDRPNRWPQGLHRKQNNDGFAVAITSNIFFGKTKHKPRIHTERTVFPELLDASTPRPR